MIRVRLLGGAKRSIGREYVDINADRLSVRELLSFLASMSNDPSIFTYNNIIVVINGAEASLLGGLDAVISSNDKVSVLTVVHGGCNERYEMVRLGRDELYVMLFTFTALIDDPIRFLMDIKGMDNTLHIQVVNTDNILGREHVVEVVKQSIEAERRGVLLAERVEMDMLLRLAYTDQIARAIEVVGLRHGINNAMVIAWHRYDALVRLGNRLSMIFAGTEDRSKNKDYKHIIALHNIEELDSTISDDDYKAMVGILAERANLLYR